MEVEPSKKGKWVYKWEWRRPFKILRFKKAGVQEAIGKTKGRNTFWR